MADGWAYNDITWENESPPTNPPARRLSILGEGHRTYPEKPSPSRSNETLWVTLSADIRPGSSNPVVLA